MAVRVKAGRRGGKIGGKRRLKTMTTQERRKIATKAAAARWRKTKRFMKRSTKMKHQPIKAQTTILRPDSSVDDILDALSSSDSGRITVHIAGKSSAETLQKQRKP